MTNLQDCVRFRNVTAQIRTKTEIFSKNPLEFDFFESRVGVERLGSKRFENLASLHHSQTDLAIFRDDKRYWWSYRSQNSKIRFFPIKPRKFDFSSHFFGPGRQDLGFILGVLRNNMLETSSNMAFFSAFPYVNETRPCSRAPSTSCRRDGGSNSEMRKGSTIESIRKL